MNCCDYNCNQGRNCPARATVAKVGQRYMAAEPLTPSVFPAILKRAARVALLGTLELLLYSGLLLLYSGLLLALVVQ